MSKKGKFFLDKPVNSTPQKTDTITDKTIVKKDKKTLDKSEKTISKKPTDDKQKTSDIYKTIKTDESINPIESVKNQPLIKRPFDEALFNNIINDISSGLSIVNACKKNNIAYSTIQNWICTQPQLATQLHHARVQRTTLQLETTIDIANDAIRVADGDTRQAVAQVQARKLLIETIYKTATKLCPDEFGDRIRTDIAGVQGAPVGTISITADQLLQIQKAEQDALNQIKSKLLTDQFADQLNTTH